jgi:hypothetical protein
VTSRSLFAALVARSQGYWLAALVATAPAAGCVDPQKDYEDFLARPVLVPEAGAPDVVLTPCQELLQQDPSGSYLLTCIVKLFKDLPFSLGAQLTVAETDVGPTVAVSFQPLGANAATLADVTGDRVDVPSTAIAPDCTFVGPVGHLELPPNSNSLDLQVVADDVVLRARFQSPSSACGDLDGTVTTPPDFINLTGNGDTCIFTRTLIDAPLQIPSPSALVCDPAQLPQPAQ